MVAVDCWLAVCSERRREEERESESQVQTPKIAHYRAEDDDPVPALTERRIGLSSLVRPARVSSVSKTPFELLGVKWIEMATNSVLHYCTFTVRNQTMILHVIKTLFIRLNSRLDLLGYHKLVGNQHLCFKIIGTRKWVFAPYICRTSSESHCATLSF
jgi:hypothetical protein